MSKLYKQSVLAGVILASFFYLEGCTAVVIGVSEQAYRHIRGDLLGITPEPLEKVYPASVRALESLESYDMAEHNLNTISGYIVAYDSKARKIQIDLSKTEHNQTRISIRIGTVGDKLESVYIYDQIQHHIQFNPVSQNSF